MAVLEEQELACHRYAGDDPTILAPVEAYVRRSMEKGASFVPVGRASMRTALNLYARHSEVVPPENL